MAKDSQTSIPLVDELPAPNEKPTSKNKGGRPKGAKTKPKTDTAPPRVITKSSLRDAIAGMYGFAGAALVFVNQDAAQVVIEGADEIANAWIEVCDQSPAVRKFWEQATTGGAWGKVVMVHLPVVLALAPGGSNLLSGIFGGGGSSRPKPGRASKATAPPPPPPPTQNAYAPPPGDVDLTFTEDEAPPTAAAAFGDLVGQ